MTSASRRIDADAATWAARLHARELSAQEQSELDAWLSANERHRGAFLRARAAGVTIDRLAALGGQQMYSTPTHRGPAFWPLRIGLAASIVAAVIGAFVYWPWPASTHYATAVGAIDNIQLSDGSHVTLNTDTSIKVALAEHERRVQMEKGEALFEVAKDPSRPFIVQVGAISVRAVGTAFSIRATEHRTDVIVTEGTVELTDHGAPGAPLVRRVTANEQATVEQRRQLEVQPITVDRAERQLAWRQRMLDFSGETLVEAAAQINRYNEIKIVVSHPELAEQPIIGNFRADDPHGFAETVAAAFGARATSQGDTILLQPRDAS